MTDLARKARENVAAALRLLPDEYAENGEQSSVVQEDSWDRMPNASASRAYYAAYQATAHLAREDGRPFDSRNGNYYLHHEFPTKALHWHIITHQQRTELALLLQLRVKADYWEEDVDLEEASTAAECAKTFVATLLGDEPS